MTHDRNRNQRNLLGMMKTQSFQMSLIIIASLAITAIAGCARHRHQQVTFGPSELAGAHQPFYQQLEYADIQFSPEGDGSDLVGERPITISEFEGAESWELTLEECLEYALANSEVLQKLGGVVVTSPQAVNTVYDQALVETGVGSVEDALAAFDAQWNASLLLGESQRRFNNPLFGGGVNSLVNNTGNYNAALLKQTASGASFGIVHFIDYTRSNIPIATPDNPFGNRFASIYDVVARAQIRQPLLRGRGTMVNRIAGPNPIVGVYNGVMIARIRSDISLTDFEMGLRNLVRDVEQNYWELYFAYQDLDTKLAARESARETWSNRKLRLDIGVDRPDEEAQARQLYYTFENQAQNALAGVNSAGFIAQLGLLGAERNLRRLMGVLSSDGRLIKPVSEPAIAPIQFDWNHLHQQAMQHRAELRRQQWVVKQRELELFAARALNQWQFDLVGQSDRRGFGSQLFGLPGVEDGNALRSLFSGNLNDWSFGFEVGGAIGNRREMLAIRNAEVNLIRDRKILVEQQRQITLDLNAAFTEVDRALAAMRTNFNSLIAVQEELEPKRRRVEEGQEQVFFLLDAQQRLASSESAVHRSVIDYNQALLNLAFSSDNLLNRYNIMLAEGPWSTAAQSNAAQKAGRFPHDNTNRPLDLAPVSAGGYNQNRSDGFFPGDSANFTTATGIPGGAEEIAPGSMEGNMRESYVTPPTSIPSPIPTPSDLLPAIDIPLPPDD